MMFKKYSWVAAIALFVLGALPATTYATWGANYFPNVELTTHEGEKVRFFDDMIKDKVVAINFIYTHCPDTCPLETAQLVRVQNILGDDVLGKEVHFYSISIDPERDTPEVLTEYRERFGAKWTFLTGDKQDIIKIRKKLGLYIPEIQDGSNNHNVNMIIGNQKTGRWMKRSPFENTHLLADQIGNWLTGYKKKQKRVADYASAPKLRQIPRGEQMFRTRCSHCHSVNGEEVAGALGPDLLGVSQRRTRRWLYDWLKAPDQMIKNKDPVAMEMYERYNKLLMPNMRLKKEEADDLLAYIDDETQRILGVPVPSIDEKPVQAEFTVSSTAPGDDVVAIMNAWVREAHEKASVNAGYMTLVNAGDEAVTLLKVESDAYNKIEVHEMVPVDGLMEMREVEDLTIPANGNIKFAPGGKHLMLMGPKEHLAVGQKVDMTLVFKSGKKQQVSIKVAAK